VERSGLGSPSLHLVETLEDGIDFLRWMGEKRPHNAIGVDIETGERPGKNPKDALSPWHGQIRTVQVGDSHSGWTLPWAEWSGLFYQAMALHTGPIICHNITFEAKWFSVQSRWKFPWHQMHDTMLMAQIIMPNESAALKMLTARLIDPMAAHLQGVLDDGKKEHGWTWGTVPIDYPPYWQYGALDPVITTRLFLDHFYPMVKPGATYSEPYELEMAVRRIATTMELNGARVDLEYCENKYESLVAYTETVKKWGKDTYEVSITSPIQLGRLFIKMGAEISKFTPTGNPSIDKEQLALLARDGSTEVRNLASTVLSQRKADKLASSYFQNFTEDAIDGILHPSINIMAARTSRMCIPTTHRIVTDRGILSVDDVVVGDKTIDKDGNWVPIKNIYKYEDQPVIAWSDTLASTPEHRWVWNYESRNKRHLEPTKAGTRHVLNLAPPATFDFSSKTISAVTEGEKFAALIGWLITDGRCVEEGYGFGLKSILYQTETKFYKEILGSIPEESVMYDTSRPTPLGTNIIHEIGIKARWLRPRLEEAGLHIETSLKESSSLLKWVSELPLNELRSFMSASFLADGSTAVANHKIVSSQSANTREVFMLAGYRLGYSSTVFSAPPSEWSNGDRYSVRFKKAIFGMRTATETHSVEDVWCVSTETGTFTAWSTGPYLTGNSITNPALQTLPSNDPTVRDAFIPRNEGEVLVTADLDQVEFRLTANFSGDPALIRLFLEADETGGDVFTSIMRQVYQDDTLQKPDSRRKLIKGVVYGKLYGAGVDKMAITAGVAESQMRSVVQAFDNAYPGVKTFQKTVEREGQFRLDTEGQAYVLTNTGRRLPADSDRIYSLTNYKIQASAAEIFKQNLVNLDMQGFTDYMVVPVHDEIVLSVPAAEARSMLPEIQEAMTTREGWQVPLTSGAEGPFPRWGWSYHEENKGKEWDGTTL